MSELAKGCSHFDDFKKAHGLQSYRIIYQYLVKPTPEARKLKASACPVRFCVYVHVHVACVCTSLYVYEEPALQYKLLVW